MQTRSTAAAPAGPTAGALAHRPVPDAARPLPRVGLAGAWFDPTDPAVWSGIPARLVGELEALGAYAGYRDVTPWAAPSRALRRWLAATGRCSDTWPLRAEMRALAALRVATARWRTPPADAWVVPAGAQGVAVRGRVVSLSEISPAQLGALGPALASSFGMAELTPRSLGVVVAHQRRLHQRADACCVASAWAADSLVRHHGLDPARVHVVGYGPNLEPPHDPTRDFSAPRFLFVGNDWVRKHGDAVVEAFTALRRRVPSARLDVVGGHPPLDVDGVCAHGRLDRADPADRGRLERLFTAATAFVMPSAIEPFGIVYLEAARAGVASVGTRVGGTTTSIGDGGLLVDPGRRDQLLEAMTALADPDTARRLGARARARSAAFGWRQTAERVLRAVGGTGTGHLAEFLPGPAAVAP